MCRPSGAYCSAFSRKKILARAAVWINPDNIMLSNKDHNHKTQIFGGRGGSVTWGPCLKSIGADIAKVAVEVGGSHCHHGTKCQFCKIRKILKMDGGGYPVMQTYFIPMSYTCKKWPQWLVFMSCILYHDWKKCEYNWCYYSSIPQHKDANHAKERTGGTESGLGSSPVVTRISLWSLTPQVWKNSEETHRHRAEDR